MLQAQKYRSISAPVVSEKATLNSKNIKVEEYKKINQNFNVIQNFRENKSGLIVGSN